MDEILQFKSTYEESAHRLKITIAPTATADVRMERSKVRYRETVMRLGPLVEKVREVPGVKSASPRRDRIYFTIAKENADEFGLILDNVFHVIRSELESATDRTDERIAELSEHTVTGEEFDDGN